ncbi:phosphatase PAP2 family protein [Actinoallomurus purpureus]|uniref:phosphatase PAP2 family protein n=1 Tax=Actinoallomurus purpureus TaxID=478114 RepID=UPI002092DDA8|nr:phosphatase PAP2 family protein [Actinoallomurus purpureus]MCO6006686.1 phosphatase PAP2 family protein [Actinoallomurus purpureus]
MTKVPQAYTAPLPAFHAAPARPRNRWWREVLLLIGMYVMYDGVRMLMAVGHGQAFADAHHVLGIERALRIADERTINHAVSGHPVLGVSMSYAYATLHYLVTPIVLVWLWKRRPWHYARARTTLVVATLLGLVGFWLFPTAPPRMLPGFIDTLGKYHEWGWWSGDASAPKGLGGLTNEFAAMPSLHVGWAAWCGWQIARNTARRGLQVLAVAYPIFIVAVVIGTANHYIADAVAGLAVIVVGAGVAGAAGRFRDRSPVPRMVSSS